MKYKSFWFYYLYTFLLLALIPIFAILFNEGSLDFDDAAARATARTGLEWTSNLLVMIRLCVAEPILLLIVLGSAIPTLAAILVLLFSKRANKWKTLGRRLLPIKGLEWRRALKIYGLIFLLLIPCLFIVYILRQATGGNYPRPDDIINFSLIPSIFLIAFLDQGAVLEEIGWRGFAQHELQDKGMKSLRAAILIGVCWGLWHLPRDVTTGVIERLGILSYILYYLPSFILGTVSISIIASYFMNKLGGSVIPAIIVHGITNDAIGLSGSASIVEALTPYHQITQAIPFMAIAIILVLLSGPNLNRSVSL